MNLLDIEFQWYANGIGTTVPSGWISLGRFIQSIQSPKESLKKAYKEIEEAGKSGDVKHKDELKKKHLFFVTPSVKLNGSRSYDSIKEFTPFCVLEYDKIPYAEVLRDYIFDKFESCIVAYTSPSKTGCKFIFYIETPKDIEDYKSLYWGIAYHLDKFVNFDPSNQNCVLPLFCSWDENIRVRENPKKWSRRGFNTNSIDYVIANRDAIEPIGVASEKIKKDIENLCVRSFKKIEDNGHPQVIRISTLLGGASAYYGLDEDEVLELIDNCIEANDYLSKNIKGYKRTARQMFDKGFSQPTPLNNDKNE